MVAVSGTPVSDPSFVSADTDGSGFDRDLGVAGRAMVRTGDGSIVQKLVKVDRPSMALDHLCCRT